MFGFGKASSLAFRGTVENRAAVKPLLHEKGDVVLVERGSPRMLVVRCPCGCGDDLLINLDKRAGKAWRFYLNSRGVTLYPSYWRDDGCGSHFIVWNNRIYWCSSWDDVDDRWAVSDEIEAMILKGLPRSHFVSYLALADQLNLIPWEVLQACHQLVRKRKVIADKRPRDADFRRLG